MKKFITNAELNQVLELLGLPGETLHIEIGSRSHWMMIGPNSGWALRAVIGQHGAPYSERVVYVPVMLPSDKPPAPENRIRQVFDAALDDVRKASQSNGEDWRDAAYDRLPDVEEKLGVKSCQPVPCPPFEETKFEVLRCPTCGSAELKWQPGQQIECTDEFHDYGF